MNKLLKIIGIAVAVVVVLVIGAVVAASMLLDPQELKAQVAAKVKEETGRELSIPGEVSISVFPWLGVQLGEVSLGNAKGFQAPVFASTEKVDVRVKLMPLLSRRVEMDTIAVDGLTLNLERNAKGAGNWEDLAKGGEPSSKAAEGAAPGDAALAAVAIGGVDVRNAKLTYRDAQSGKAYSLENVSLKTGALSPGRPVDVELGLDVTSEAPPMRGRITGAANVDVDPDKKLAAVKGLSITADMKGDTLPGGAAKATLGADAVFDGGKQTLAVENLKLAVLDLAATGALRATDLDKGAKFAGSLSVSEFSPRKLLAALGATVETADANALARASLETKLSGGVDALALEPLSVRLDDTTLGGKASVANFARPAIRFALELDAIDLDRYLPPGKEAPAATPAATPGAAAGAAGGAPPQALRDLDAAGTFKAGKVRVAKLNLSDVAATLNAKDGLIRLSPVGAKLYDGSYSGNIVLDARKDTPALSLDEKLAGVKVEPLITDLQGGESKLSGTAEASAKLTAQGAGAEAIKKTLNGNLSFALREGAVKGYNVGHMIREYKSYLGKEVSYDPAQKTDFAEITGTAKVTNGVINNPDLSAKSPLLRVTGAGEASLPTETIDYRATATLVATSKGQGGKDLGELSGVPLPIHITGTFAEPKPRPDFQALVQGIATSKGKEVIEQQKAKVTEKVQESVGKSLGDKAGGLLKGILGN